MTQHLPSNSERSRRNRNMRIGLAVILALIVTSSAVLYLNRNTLPAIPFDYHLDIYPSAGTVQQGHSFLIKVNTTYVQGTPEAVTLNASADPIGLTWNFSYPTGTATSAEVFTSNLTIDVPSSAPTNQYLVNITATSDNGRQYSTLCTLSVLSVEIQVSGTVSMISSDPIYPTQIQFVNTETNATYTTVVIATADSPPTARLIQQGTYSISLPNHQTYRVICTWYRLFGPWISDSDAATGTFDGGTLTVNCDAGVTSITRDYSG